MFLVMVQYGRCVELHSVVVSYVASGERRDMLMKKEYSWKYFQFSTDAQKVGSELEKLEVLGELTNDMIVDYAKNHPKSELFKCFEWNDTEAGRKYRLYQASQILSSISVKITEEPVQKQKVYYSIKSAETKKKVFKNIKDIVENDEEYLQLIDKASEELNACKDKYETLIKKEDLKDILFEIYRKI